MSRIFGTDISNAHPIDGITKCTSVAPIIISIEAAIGTGKSSLLHVIESYEPSWVVVQEPVDMWRNVSRTPSQSDDHKMTPLIEEEHHNLLEAFYNDPTRFAFSFQTYCVLSRIESVTSALEHMIKAPLKDKTLLYRHNPTQLPNSPSHHSSKIIPSGTNPPVMILERSWFSDRHTFAEMLRKQSKISPMEWCLYERWYDFAVKNSPAIHGHIYLECTPATCMQRLKKRGRSEEVSVTHEYQVSLIQHHEDWLDTLPSSSVCRVNVDEEFVQQEANREELIKIIRNFVAKLAASRT